VTIGELIELAGQQSHSHPQAGYMARAAVTDLILRAAGLDGNEDRGEIALAIIGAAGRASLGSRILTVLRGPLPEKKGPDHA
jgi:hypothetical protein